MNFIRWLKREALYLQTALDLCGSFFPRKKYEGSNYQDGTNGADIADNAISPGTAFKYVWKVPERAGPTGYDGNCLVWAYYSDSFSVKDFYSGLVGPLIVCKKVMIITL